MPKDGTVTATPPQGPTSSDSVNLLDWSASEGGGFEPLEPGPYTAYLADIVQKDAKSSGKPMFEFTFNLDKGNRKMWHICSLQPKALFNLRNLLQGLGMTGDEIVAFRSPAELLTEIRRRYQGAHVQLEVILARREDTGEMTNRISEFALLEPPKGKAGAATGTGATAAEGELW